MANGFKQSTRQGASVFPGRPFPLGATPGTDGTNFAVYADTDSGLQLCLIDADGSERVWDLDERTSGIWHTFVPGVGVGQRYGYRVPSRDGSKILLDPYARRVHTTSYDLVVASAPGRQSLGSVPLGIVTAPPTTPQPGRATPWEHTVIYEAHVQGLTAGNPHIEEHLRGTYLGVAHPATIDHLQQLGVTALELLPIHAFASEPSLTLAGRQNYWGYSTLSYFSPHPGYASRFGAELDEFVTMVDTLHAAGIELILDVVYNHTAESVTPKLPILSWRGLAPATYYLPTGIDLTGCGNTLDPGSLACVRMVCDSLRYWAGEVGVDGFRFDLAPVLGRRHGGGFDAASAMLTAIAADPLLATCKLIAEPWDATAAGYALGRFGSDWAEWNDRFRDDVRDFWRGAGRVRYLAGRLAGSQDIFGGRGPWASVNFVTSHDGFSLRDVVSYANKHNAVNGEDNRDGSSDNRSANYGVEGPTEDPAIQAIRQRQARNLAATTLLATGTPMMRMGDEFWHTCGGNNNAYVVSPATAPIDFQRATTDQATADMFAFFCRLTRMRAECPALRQGEFFTGRSGDSADLVWFSERGTEMTQAEWLDDGRTTLMMWVNGADVRGHGRDEQVQTDDSYLLIFHCAPDPVTITLPEGPYGQHFVPVLDTDTADGQPTDTEALAAGTQAVLPGRTMWVLRAK